MKRLCLLMVACLCGASTASAAEPFEAFLNKHCLRCHGPKKKAKGDLRIDRLSRDFKAGADGHLWAEIVERINAGEMPPKKEPQPTEGEIAAVIAQLDSRISEGQAARMAARPPVAHYRLSRKEYQNTVYDLLGVRYDPTKPGELNEDTLWHGYERIGSQLSLSPSPIPPAEVVLFPSSDQGERCPAVRHAPSPPAMQSWSVRLSAEPRPRLLPRECEWSAGWRGGCRNR